MEQNTDNNLIIVIPPTGETYHQSIQNIRNAFEKLLIPAVRQAADALNRLSKVLHAELSLSAYIDWQTAAKEYGRLFYLAKHAKKRRVRKKNLKRLFQLSMRR